VLELIFEAVFRPYTYGFDPGIWRLRDAAG